MALQQLCVIFILLFASLCNGFSWNTLQSPIWIHGPNYFTTQQSIEVVNPIAKLLRVDEVKTNTVIDHIISVRPQLYETLNLQLNEFLIVINLQYQPFKKSIVAYNIIDMDQIKQNHTEPAYVLLSKFLTITGAKGEAVGKLEMLDVNVAVKDVPKMFSSMIPENPRNKLDVANSKCFQNKQERYIEIDIRVDLSPESKEIFQMLEKVPSFIPVSSTSDWAFILRADSQDQVPERMLLGFYAIAKR